MIGMFYEGHITRCRCVCGQVMFLSIRSKSWKDKTGVWYYCSTCGCEVKAKECENNETEVSKE